VEREEVRERTPSIDPRDAETGVEDEDEEDIIEEDTEEEIEEEEEEDESEDSSDNTSDDSDEDLPSESSDDELPLQSSLEPAKSPNQVQLPIGNSNCLAGLSFAFLGLPQSLFVEARPSLTNMEGLKFHWNLTKSIS
jgi:hypothetical protein